ncbi:ABC-2 transporter permease [Desulfitobacterium sp.]|uniref:ABC-2 transporter permease n=1 Tax=Desulfitobacterium sp. TaxID=49981 RepID=UPI002C29F793|nr:ABC-2 transporter permease [Desulfitobacterium sp.]HVJ48561.1 ABC-2 transporter permease [Desulfitobacterium sp.]
MLNLILKDLILNKKYLGYVLVYGIFLLIAFQALPGGQFIAITVGIGYILMINATAYDDKNNFEIILNSLPISRSKIVYAKYLSILLYTALAIVSYLLAAFIIQIFHLAIYVSPLTPLGVINALFTLGLMSGVYYPLYFKIGYLKSNLIRTLVFMLFFFAPLFLSGYLQSKPKNPLLRSLLETINSLSSTQLSLIFLFLTMIFIGISLVLSLRFYERREF